MAFVQNGPAARAAVVGVSTTMGSQRRKRFTAPARLPSYWISSAPMRRTEKETCSSIG